MASLYCFSAVLLIDVHSGLFTRIASHPRTRRTAALPVSTDITVALEEESSVCALGGDDDDDGDFFRHCTPVVRK